MLMFVNIVDGGWCFVYILWLVLNGVMHACWCVDGCAYVDMWCCLWWVGVLVDVTCVVGVGVCY